MRNETTILMTGKWTMGTLTIALLLTALAMGQENPSEGSPAPETGEITPPLDVEIQPPPAEEVVPAPDGRREGGLRLDRELDLGKLQEEFGPQGRRFLHRSGEGGISFGLDMARRGINFGLRYANGQATPADARAFGIDMGRRGKAFGLEMHDRALEFGEEVGGDAVDRLPVDGRDAEFQETPGDITIDAPPTPLGVDTPRAKPEAKIYGREYINRPVKFRREL